MNYQPEEDLYRCMSFTSLKEKLITTQDSIEKARTIRASGHCDKQRMSAYIKILLQRRSEIVKRIDHLADVILGKTKARELKMIHEKIAALNRED